MGVVSDAHRPGKHGFFRLAIDFGDGFDLATGDAGFRFDLHPRERVDRFDPSFVVVAMLTEEVLVHVSLLLDRFGDPPQQRQVAADVWLHVLCCDLGPEQK